MRIDYSPPKQSCVSSGQSKPRPRKEPVSKVTSLIVVTALIAFAVGFSAGWFLSEKSTKKAFQAATEQKSLENAPKPVIAPPLSIQAPTEPAQSDVLPKTAQPSAGTPQATPPPKATPDSQLSFYKTLPSGQKTNLMGSGVNAKGEKEKQPLQAAIPSNIARKPQGSPNSGKPSTDKPAASPTRENNGFTVQVASYSLKSEAEAMKNKLAAKGYNVTVSESNQGDRGTWYRVRVGRRLEQGAAKELAAKIGKGATVFPE